ncbi:MAG: hypothetical protein JWM28_2944 [Chitinophagaceae bacterium]|nr:hypothetical protein [Chitinophagaceae bacterium]
MKRVFTTVVIIFFTTLSFAQIGIGTTTPNSTLDVRGSLAVNFRAFTTSTTAATTDNTLVFTGTAVATLTLPDATTCTGRVYWAKNASSNTSLLTINTTSSQTIDGLATWLLDEANESVRLVSNGTNWYVSAQSLPTGSGTNWSLGGNSVPSLKTIGTINNYDLPFITNNTEQMRLSSTGSLGLGVATFDGSNPEKFLVDADTTSSINAIVTRGTINSYIQFNIQNKSGGGQASTDIVATANNGTETTNYIDLGINGGGYNNANNILSGADNGYLFSSGQDFIIGNSAPSNHLIFFTGGIATINERMRITSAGNLGIGITNPADKLTVAGVIAPSADNTYTLGKSGSRWSYVWSANGTIQTSDLRLKKNIHDLPYGLNEVMQLKPVGYNWKDNTGGDKIGLIAQEVRKIIPEVVVGDESKENLGMNYAELVPVLINAIKEQQQQLKGQQEQIDFLKKEIELLKTKK